MSGHDDLVEAYLDQLYARLRGSPRQGRRLLAEAEDHLRQGVEEGLAGGLSLREAQEHAISSFGSVRAVVRAHDTRLRRLPSTAVLADLVMSGWKLGSVGLLAVGASGLVAAAMNAIFGRPFVGAQLRGTTLPAASCRYWLSNWPGAHSCTQAYLLESSSDAVSLRVAAGLLGLLLLAGYYLARRRGWSTGVLPDGFTPTVAVSLFGTAGLCLAGLAAMRGRGVLAVGGHIGPGFFLSGALVALAVAAGYGWQLQRSLLQHARR
ncbi:MAG TPA: permease prefix domain 1-containing protein [Streptosporangiaceae bacterium]|nr:permease prefix domain 1-containing protein [Streptosporangiaceae bacterium]